MLPEPIDSHVHRVLSGVSRVAVLEALRVSTGGLDVQAISEQVGLHANTVRSHLERLMEAGLVGSSVQARSTPGRPRLLFRACATTEPAPEDSYKLLAGILASGIAASDQARSPLAAEAGRRWGHQIAQDSEADDVPIDADRAMDRIVALLDEVGFAPTISDDTSPASAQQDLSTRTVIELHRCPFRDVAQEHSEVVCAVHLGLMQGALEQMHAPAVSIRLEPFARPGVCLAHLGPAGINSTGGAA